MSATVRQTSFSAGELEPLLWGRTDLPLFGRGLRTCRNFFIAKSGAAVSRPGTLFVNESGVRVAIEFGEDIGVCRLVPFVFSDDESYVLEFGIGYIRFHTLGRTVLSGGSPYEILGTAIAGDDLPKLRFAQVGNVLTVCIPRTGFQAPYELRRLGPTNWTWTRAVFTPPDPVLPDVGASLMPDPYNPTAPRAIITTPFMLYGSSLKAPTDDHPAQEWVWAFTAIMQRISDGTIFESVAQVVKYVTDGVERLGSGDPVVQVPLADHQVVLDSETHVKLGRLGLQEGVDPTYRTLAFRIYRGRGDLFGWVGDTRNREFIDTGDVPDYTVQPPLGTNPFRVLQRGLGGPHVAVPVTVGFFQERRIFGGATGETDADPLARPATLFASAVGDYYNFDARLAFDVSGEALVLDLASRKYEEIRHLVPMDKLVVLTNSTARTVGGTQGPLDFDDVDARVVDEVGSTGVVPAVVDGCVLFVRTKGVGARALIPQASDTPYQGVDISEQARHLFLGKGRQIVDWAYAEDPWGVVWAVREDGVLLSLTFTRNQVAWARHDTDGIVESICSVPEGEEDAVYLVVKRVINGESKRFIERMTSRVRRVLESDPDPVFTAEPSADDTDSLYPTDVCVDCGFTYAGVPVLSIEDAKLLNLVGKNVWVVARGSAAMGPFLVTDTGNGTGLVQIADDLSVALPPPNAVDTDGNPIWVAHVGLAFTADLESLAISGGETLKQKALVQVGFELDSARGIKAGQKFTKLTTWQQRTFGDGFDAISAATALVYTAVDNSWDKAARVVLRQEQPLPVTVVGITREYIDGR